MDLGIALEGFFFEKVNGSTGRVTFTFTILYMRRLTPHSCKKHMAYDSRRHQAHATRRLLLARRVYFLVYKTRSKNVLPQNALSLDVRSNAITLLCIIGLFKMF